ncbi:hypothetical protein SHKM778_19770 [Streptomyces sp. KM77-8]|uniref:MFS transporter n=1 Tax=Streptomyces haneummycinicus TaxID=3074435 RepID=A0AAT9HDU2_9ACTN
MAAVLPVVYGLKELPSEGWNVRYVVAITVGLLFAALFVHRQRTTASPMISPALFRGHGFTPALALNTLSAFGVMGSAYFTTQYFQSVLGKSALEAALWSLLPSVLIGVAAPVATLLVQRGAERAYVVTAGFVISAGGYGLLALAGTDSLWLVLAACGMIASGIVVVMSLLTDLALSSAPVEKAGAASSLFETGTEFGGALGMAALGSIGTAVYRHEIPDAAPAAAQETLGGALAVAAELPGRAGTPWWRRPGRRSPAVCRERRSRARYCCSARPGRRRWDCAGSGYARKPRTPDRLNRSARPACEDEARSG